jgi:hypothetical protein
VRRLAITLLLPLLLLAACGSDDTDASGNGGADDQSTAPDLDEEERAFAELMGLAMYRSSQEDKEPDDLDLSREDADCISAVIVDTIGMAELIALGFDEESLEDDTFDDDALDDFDMSEEQATAMWDGMVGCVNFGMLMAEAIADDDELGPESARCLGDGLMEIDAFREGMILSFMGQDPDDAEMEAALMGPMMRLMTECLSDEELEAIMGL